MTFARVILYLFGIYSRVYPYLSILKFALYLH